MELLEEITANSDFCVHIERELLKVCEMHVSLPDLPTDPTLSDACTGVSYRTFFNWGVSRSSMCSMRAHACTDTEAGDIVVLPLPPSPS